ncbi:MAG: FKBP-type peptidyl-prolyl cis-trans isomerase [Verrucomicrobiales bacterium]|jgi:FKBP-type peptidyl-prolyl cis-trans isomerase
MHYVGVRHSDGGEFDASWNRGTTFDFVLGQGRVIQGWDQGIVGMKEGGRRLLSIPADLAYGDQERGADIPANSALVFVVDLVTVATPPTVENAPAPVTELEVTVLEEGDGVVIGEGSTVQLHYRAVLQTTGEVFASSWESGQPASFVVNAEVSQSLPAWDLALPGLHVGDVIRMVIPPGLGIDDPSGEIPADATIITEMTILGVVG